MPEHEEQHPDEQLVTVDPRTPALAPPAEPLPFSETAPVVDSADEFLSNDTMPTDYVFLPVQKKRMRIRGIRSRERAELEKRLEEVRRVGTKGKTVKETNLKLFREWLIIYGAIKKDGAQMFGTEHKDRLHNMASGDINAVAEGIMHLSGIGDDEVDDMVGNSDGAPSGS